MSATVIVLADRRPANLAHLFLCDAYKALPFVTLKEPHERSEGYNDGISWWNDVPTDHGHVDHKRGITYAQMAVAAIEADQCSLSRALELTFQDIYLDAVRRRERGGRYSRSMPPASSAFLTEIAKVIHLKARGAA